MVLVWFCLEQGSRFVWLEMMVLVWFFNASMIPVWFGML